MLEKEKITDLYCFVSVTEKGEGIIGRATETPHGVMLMPLVTSNETLMEMLKPIAKQIGIESNFKVKLLKFTHREELEELTNVQ